jgi:hypothetical protein
MNTLKTLTAAAVLMLVTGATQATCEQQRLNFRKSGTDVELQALADCQTKIFAERHPKYRVPYEPAEPLLYGADEWRKHVDPEAATVEPYPPRRQRQGKPVEYIPEGGCPNPDPRCRASVAADQWDPCNGSGGKPSGQIHAEFEAEVAADRASEVTKGVADSIVGFHRLQSLFGLEQANWNRCTAKLPSCLNAEQLAATLTKAKAVFGGADTQLSATEKRCLSQWTSDLGPPLEDCSIAPEHRGSAAFWLQVIHG